MLVFLPFWPDLVLLLNITTMYLLEFMSTIMINSVCKADKYHPLNLTLQENYSNNKLFNLSISSLGIFNGSSDSFSLVLMDLQFGNAH